MVNTNAQRIIRQAGSPREVYITRLTAIFISGSSREVLKKRQQKLNLLLQLRFNATSKKREGRFVADKSAHNQLCMPSFKYDALKMQEYVDDH